MKDERTATLEIATPEGVTFSLPLAGPMTRSLAYFIDLLVMSAIFNILRPVLEGLQVIGGDAGAGLAILAQFLFIEGGRTISELLWRGQTPGKKVLGLRVMDERGLRLQPSQLVVRNLLRFVDVLPLFYAVGGAVSLFSSKAQRLGDLAAGTVVVRSLKTAPPDVAAVLSGKFNSFLQHPALEARLRNKTTPEEAQLALQALLRRDQLEPAARVQLYAGLAAQFRDKVAFPEETVFGLSDEQHVRNVADTIFRRRRSGG